LPEGWSPDTDDWNEADRALGAIGARSELAKFRDHWKQQPGSKGVKLDWNATWRNWVRRAAEYAGGRNGTAQVRPDKSLTDSIRRELAELEGPESADTALPARPVLRIS